MELIKNMDTMDKLKKPIITAIVLLVLGVTGYGLYQNYSIPTTLNKTTDSGVITLEDVVTQQDNPDASVVDIQ